MRDTLQTGRLPQISAGDLDILKFELERRDLSFARPFVDPLRRVCRAYFRTDVQGLEKIPDGPIILVANHSGGSSTPDSVVLILELIEHRGLDWPLVWLGHRALLALPGVGDFLKRCGVIPAKPELARAALAAGAAVLVYPGGEVELHRPWSARDQIRFEDHRGFVRLAMASGAPIVPIVCRGAHETYFPITDGQRWARALRLDRAFGLKVLPVSLGLPWGVNSLLPHLPLPSHIAIRVLDPVDVSRYDGEQDAYEDITGRMQEMLTRLAGEAGGDDARN